MAFTDSADTADTGGPASSPRAGPIQPTPGGPPGAGQGSPVLAALARKRAGMQPSAPGMGNEADALMQLKTAVDMITAALPGLQAGGKQHTQAVNALRQLSRILPQGAPTAGAQQTQVLDLLRGIIRNGLMQKVMANRGGAQAPPGAGDAGTGPAGPDEAQAPMPSTPLPGA